MLFIYILNCLYFFWEKINVDGLKFERLKKDNLLKSPTHIYLSPAIKYLPHRNQYFQYIL